MNYGNSRYRLFTLMPLGVAIIIACISYVARSFGGMFLAVLFFLISLLGTGRLTNFVLFACSITFSLAIAEFSMGEFGVSSRITVDTYFSPDSDSAKPPYLTMSPLGYLAAPGTHTIKKLTRSGDTVYDVVYSIGDDGFRLTPQAKTSTRSHVNFFGCSFMFGEGLEDTETLPYYFHSLEQHASVKNYGMHGYGVHQALRILESKDIEGGINFLLTAPWHSDRAACIPDFSYGSPKYVLKDGRVFLDGTCSEYSIRTRILNHFNLYGQIRQLIRERSQDEEIELYMALINRLHVVSRDRGQRFIVGFIKADVDWFSGKYSNQKIVDELIRMGIEVIDLTLAISSEKLAKEYYIHEKDRHPSARANRTRAVLIQRHLTEHPS